MARGRRAKKQVAYKKKNGITETNAGLNLCYRLKRIALADKQIVWTLPTFHQGGVIGVSFIYINS